MNVLHQPCRERRERRAGSIPRRGQPRLPCAVKRRSVASRHSPRQHVLARLYLRADQMPQRIAAGLLPVPAFLAHLLQGAALSASFATGLTRKSTASLSTAAWLPFPPPFIPIIDIPRQCFHAPPSLGYTERPARVQFMLGRVGLYERCYLHAQSFQTRAAPKRRGVGLPRAKRCGGRTAASCRGRPSWTSSSSRRSRALPSKNDAARLQNVGAIGDGERHLRVLLNQQHRHALLLELLDDLENLRHQNRRQAHRRARPA